MREASRPFQTAQWRNLIVLSYVVILFAAALPAPAQGPAGGVRGLVYDSLLRGPLIGAHVMVREVAQGAQTDSVGRFRFDSVAPGRYTLLVSHPALDVAGLHTIGRPLVVVPGEIARVTLATPSLATVWRRLCGAELGSRRDSGIVYGVVRDLAGTHLAGAALLATWIRLRQPEGTDVGVEQFEAQTRTDSLGAYQVCGVPADFPIRVRAFARADSSGAVDVRVHGRALARQDLVIALAESAAQRRTAALRGVVRAEEGGPIARARVVVDEGGSTLTDDNGGFVVAGLPGGTQWVSVHAIGRAPFEQAVVLRTADTTALDLTLGPLPIVLDPVRVLGTHGMRHMAGVEARRRSGRGYYRSEAEIKRMGSLRGVLGTIPTVRLGQGPTVFDVLVLLPKPGVGFLCRAGLFIDGRRAEYEELASYRPADLIAVEVYPRASSVPVEFQSMGSGCGVVLIWTKYLR